MGIETKAIFLCLQQESMDMSTPTTSQAQASHNSNMLKRPATVRTVQDIKDNGTVKMSEALGINDVLNSSDSDDCDYMPDCFMEISSDEESDFEDIGIRSKRVELDSGKYLYDINNPKNFMPKASTGTKRVQNQKHFPTSTSSTFVDVLHNL